jgi:ribonucleoside-diphosphate reductase beta chain
MSSSKERAELDLLAETPDRFVLFPINAHDIWEKYKKAEASFWTTEEIDLQQDIEDYNNKLTDDEKTFVNITLAFFAATDGIIAENLALNFYSEVKLAEARSFYGFQIAMENIHSEMYSLLIDTLIKDDNLKQKLFNAMENYECIKKKSEWILKWFDKSKYSFAERLVAFAAVEAISFSGSFCPIFWLKKRGLMPGFADSNFLIARDEGLHAEFACLLYNNYVPDDQKLSRERILEIIRELVECEKLQTMESLKNDLIGMNKVLLGQYIEFVADRLLKELGQAKFYGSANPFEWMDNIAMEIKPNFFEHRSFNYKRAQIVLKGQKEQRGFTTEATDW